MIQLLDHSTASKAADSLRLADRVSKNADMPYLPMANITAVCLHDPNAFLKASRLEKWLLNLSNAAGTGFGPSCACTATDACPLQAPGCPSGQVCRPSPAGSTRACCGCAPPATRRQSTRTLRTAPSCRVRSPAQGMRSHPELAGRSALV